MSTVTERIISRLEIAIDIGVEPDDIVQMLAEEGITGYDAWLAYKAAEVSNRLFEVPTPRSVDHPFKGYEVDSKHVQAK